MVPLVVVQDQLQPCPYLTDATARLPLQLPMNAVCPTEMDDLLAAGYRRSGEFVYRTQCPACQQCEPTRVNVHRFRYTKSLRRVLKRGRRDLTIHWGRPRVDATRIEMFNRHRVQRDLTLDDGSVDAEGYAAFLVNSCCPTRELAIYQDDRLVAVSIVDLGQSSLSAVYTHFDPDASRYCLGTLAVLEQIEWAKETKREWVYLGMYVAANRHLNYKSRFTPQQRLSGNCWREFDDRHSEPTEAPDSVAL